MRDPGDGIAEIFLSVPFLNWHAIKGFGIDSTAAPCLLCYKDVLRMFEDTSHGTAEHFA